MFWIFEMIQASSSTSPENREGRSSDWRTGSLSSKFITQLLSAESAKTNTCRATSVKTAKGRRGFVNVIAGTVCWRGRFQCLNPQVGHQDKRREEKS